MLLAALLGLFGGACHLAAHRGRPVRRWVPHLVMAAAMVAMALPRASGPLGPLGWSLLLAATAAGTGTRAADPLDARLPAAYDLLAMAGLLFVHWTHDSLGHEHGQGGAGPVPYGWILVALWAAARVSLTRRRHVGQRLAGLGGLATAGAMGLMLL